MEPLSFMLRASHQEAGELAALPIRERVEQLVRLAVEQRIYWGEMGNLDPIPEVSVLRRFVFSDEPHHPEFSVTDAQEDPPEGERRLFNFRATGDLALMKALAELAGETGRIETRPW